MPATAPDIPISTDQQRVLFARNNSTTANIPGFAALRVVGIEMMRQGDIVVVVDVPTADSDKMVVFNLDAYIEPSGYGYVTFDFPAVALYDVADGTPANDEDWGTKANEYKLRKGKTGFKTKAMQSGQTLPYEEVVIVLQEICRP